MDSVPSPERGHETSVGIGTPRSPERPEAPLLVHEALLASRLTRASRTRGWVRYASGRMWLNNDALYGQIIHTGSAASTTLQTDSKRFSSETAPVEFSGQIDSSMMRTRCAPLSSCSRT